MHVCMVLRKAFPRDIRVEKEARALQSAGHDVTLVCTVDGDRPRRETIADIDVWRFSEHDHPTLKRQRQTLSYLTTFVHPFWKSAIESVNDASEIDVIHVHDLPLVGTGLAAGDEFDIPVVADLHENYPEAIRQWRLMHSLEDVVTNVGLLTKYAALPVRRWKRLERSCVQQANRVLAVCEEARDHYVEDCGAAPESVAIVGNTVDRTHFDTDPEPVSGFEDEFVISYVGKFAPHRGLESVVAGFAAVRDLLPNARLLIVGAPGSEEYGRKFDVFCEDHGVTDAMTFTGWVDFEDVPRYMAASDVCLVPHASTPHTNTTIPHKLFQYMALKKPVLVSDVPPLARVVGENEAGAVATADDASEMGEALLKLADPEIARKRGENGRSAVEDRYNWESDAETLQKTYESLS
ncbi:MULTISPECIES: glycosyltransferase family 4 protein [unclassified Haladaptatus]|uniref:glycosyltransferase family 4 protein n=1 Tax=unclassified Haladaptatus TaxID=2622732 RepID=UPI0023E859FF|nr:MULTISPECIES: glycosyltransferase family 4 protein [unclassified Haladaptatus]